MANGLKLFGLSLIGLVACCAAAASRSGNVRYSEDGLAWRAAQPTNIRIKAGSALDLSAHGRPEPAGTFGRLVVGKDGHFEFERMPGVPQRLFGFVLEWCNIKWIVRDGKGGFLPDWRENLDAYAEQVRRHGYNFVRPHGMFDKMELDNWMSTGTMTEAYLDVLDYFCAALTRRGVYLYLDICAYGMRLDGKIPSSIILKNAVMNGEPKYVDAWKRCATQILARKNVYTGLAYKDDPAIACIMQFNEQATGAKIATAAELRRQGLELSPETHKALAEKFLTTARMFNAHTDAAGYGGLESNYNSDVDIGACVARWKASDVVSYNYHFGHPVYSTKGKRRGQRVSQSSSLDWTANGADFCCGIRLRFPDRPFVCSEYSHAYFNDRRYEAGILLPSYAGLNGFDGILWHANAVELENTGSWPRGRLEAFTVFSSPITRAASFLASCLYLRGDVREAPCQAIVDYAGDSWKDVTFYASNSSQAKIGLVMKTGVSFSDLPRPKAVNGPVRGDVTLEPAKGDVVYDGTWVSTVGGVGREGFDLDAFIARMKTRGILPASNRTDDKRRLYESVTGEILMDAAARTMTVTTPKTEAAALKADARMNLNVLTVESTLPSLAALTSLDGQRLGRSRRMVFIYATQESNDAFEATPDGREVVEYGSGPVILRTGRIAGRIRMDRPEGLRLYLLDYDGTRLEEIPSCVRDGAFAFTLDTSKTVHSPTPFFEIAEGPAMPPPAGIVRPGDRILLLGDSITEQGVCAVPTGQYHQLTNFAARVAGDLRPEFVGLGFSGSHIGDWEAWERRSRTGDVWQGRNVPGRRNLREEFAKGAGVLVFFLGQNDITHPLMTDDAASRAGWVGRVGKLLDTLRRRTGAHDVVLCTITACGMDPESARNRGRRRINDELAALARRRGWRIADYGRVIDELQASVGRGWRFNLAGDYVHPCSSKIGHTALAAELCRALGLERMAECATARLRHEIREHLYGEKTCLSADMSVDPGRSADKASFVWTFDWCWTDSRATESDSRRVPDVSVALPEGFKVVSATDWHAARGTVRIEGRPKRLTQSIRFAARYPGGEDTYAVPIHAPWRVVAGLDGADRWEGNVYRKDVAPSALDRGVADGRLTGAPLTVDGKTLPWEVFLSSPAYCGLWHAGNLNAEQFTFGTQTDAFYAVRKIRSPRARTVKGVFSHDTWWSVLGVRTWLNGREIYVGPVKKEGPALDLPLVAGENLLVIRADHNRGQRQFSFDLKPAAGDDLSDLEFSWR